MSDGTLAENGTRTGVLNRPVVAPNGTGSWAPGERAGFDTETAASLIARGHARGLTETEEKVTRELRERRDREEYDERAADKTLQTGTAWARVRAKFGPPEDKMMAGGQTVRK